jgi:Cu/Ag efflux protein CusF
MNTRLCALVLASALAGCAGGSDHPGHGVVVSVDPAKGEITLDHEDIPGLQQVEFRVREDAGHYVVTAIEARRP